MHTLYFYVIVKEEMLIVQISRTELQTMLEEAVRNAVSGLQNTKSNNEQYLSRKDVAELFKVTLTTINDWCKVGKLKRHHINSRVYFMKSEIETLFQPKPKDEAYRKTKRYHV